MKCTENKHPQNQSQICHQKLNPQSIPKKTTKIRQSFLQQSHPYIKVKNRLKIKIRFGNQRRINASFVHTQTEYCCVTRDEWERNNWIHAKKSKKKKKKKKNQNQKQEQEHEFYTREAENPGKGRSTTENQNLKRTSTGSISGSSAYKLMKPQEKAQISRKRERESERMNQRREKEKVRTKKEGRTLK